MKIDANNPNLDFTPENFEQPSTGQAITTPPASQVDQIQPFDSSVDGPTGQIQQGLHSDKAEGSPQESYRDYQLGAGMLMGLGGAGNFAWGALGLSDMDFTESVGKFVNSVFDGVGGTIDKIGQDIGGFPGDAISWFGNAVADTPEAVADGITWTENAISDAGQATGDAISDAAGAVADGATDVVDGAADVVSDVTDW